MVAKKRESGFFELTRQWVDHGHGTMLVFVDENSCTYVRFIDSFTEKVEVLQPFLLKLYYKQEADA